MSSSTNEREIQRGGLWREDVAGKGYTVHISYLLYITQAIVDYPLLFYVNYVN